MATKRGVNRRAVVANAPNTRTLDIIIYGMACFDKQTDGSYRVLFPDARDPKPFSHVAHTVSIWVREKTAIPTVRWPWISFQNDFYLGERSQLTYSGINPTPLVTTDFDDRLANLLDADSNYRLDPNPDAFITTFIDRGTLSAHVFPSGMIVVKWAVEVPIDGSVTFTFANSGPLGNGVITCGPDARQVIFANVGLNSGEYDADNHFVIYRKLATVKTGPLAPANPKFAPVPGNLNIIDPSDKYQIACPRVDCSGALAH